MLFVLNQKGGDLFYLTFQPTQKPPNYVSQESLGLVLVQ
jgi:hypothetical protein